MAEAINKALAHWPRDRFPDGFQSYWESAFTGYMEQTVADAIDAVRMDSDPFVPTCEMVRKMLQDWGVVPPAKESGPPAWDRIAYEKTRDECRAIAAQQAENRKLCESLSDADFERIAREQIALFDSEVRALSCYSPTRTVEQLRKSNYLNSLVAAHARAHGMTRNRVMENV